jgi:hypothetical protein
METLLVIDSYLSKEERAMTCKNLIADLREVFPNNKILLINKFNDSWGLDSLVDYYFSTKGFLVGYPPNDILNSGKYERPYTYLNIAAGTFENWYPLVNVSDHVADVFNSFVISSKIAEFLGYEKLFKVEYDTVFDLDELRATAKDIESFNDYLLYGVRKEGTWAKDHQYLVDVHTIGYSSKIFKDFKVITEDKEFWELCKLVNYYGKWVEYVIPAVIEHIRKSVELGGIEYYIKVDQMFPRTKFDTISSPGLWTTTWDEIPKICRAGNKSTDEHCKDNEIVVFYVAKGKYEENREMVHTWCRITKESTGETIYEKDIAVKPGMWIFDHLFIHEPVIINIKTDKGFEKETRLSPNDIKQIDPRFVFNQ